MNGYAELRKAGAEELLEAICAHYAQAFDVDDELYFGYLNGMIAGLRTGFRIAGLCGWKEVAPAWLEAFRRKAIIDQKGEPIER